jgi:hypothetical protein
VPGTSNGQVEAGGIAGSFDHDVRVRSQSGGLLRWHHIVEAEPARDVTSLSGRLDERHVPRPT